MGKHCKNQRFGNKIWKKLQVIKTEKKGFGVKTLENIRSGEFIIEYIGEVINFEECLRRLELGDSNKKHFYILTLGGGEFIDAGTKGSIARFVIFFKF